MPGSIRRRVARLAFPSLLLLATACVRQSVAPEPSAWIPAGAFGERMRVLDLYPGVTATIVMPAVVDPAQGVDLILYALPNGNTTAETMGRSTFDSTTWRYDIQHIAAQTRALRTLGLPQAVVAYLEADTKSWPLWRSTRGYDRANARIVEIVDQIRTAIGNPPHLTVTLTGHSGGGSFMFGFIEGQASLPSWLHRIAFLDANYNFAGATHGPRLLEWLRRDPANRLVVLAYDDREITLDGRKVVSDSGGTWRATQRMIDWFAGQSVPLAQDTLGEFVRHHAPQVDLLRHPNPGNRILHTVMIGEMNGYMHAMLVGRPAYDAGAPLLRSQRAYTTWLDGGVSLPAPTPPEIPRRPGDAPGGTGFIHAVATIPKEDRETAIRRELLAGNVPSFLRALRTVRVSAADAGGVTHTIEFEVMPDYLEIGSDADYVRMPMNPYTAQAFCDAFGFVLPTRKMVNDIWAAAPVHVDPRPLTQERESPLTFLQHHGIIEGQLHSVHATRGAFVAGIKKDVVITNKLRERPDRVAIYGWHYLTGQPIQPLYTGHVDWYVDYSHGIRPVRRAMRLDGVATTYERVLADSTLAYLLSDEGPIAIPRYDRPPAGPL